jgi:hypothetical protein
MRARLPELRRDRIETWLASGLLAEATWNGSKADGAVLPNGGSALRRMMQPARIALSKEGAGTS